jgi:RNA polymerase sigma-70 factor (sigma-E family)
MESAAEHSDDDSYSDFVQDQWSSLYRTAYLMTGDHQRAEDVVQTALMKVYLAWPRVGSMTHPAAYARKVMVNQLTSWWRRRSSTESPTLMLVEATQPGFDDTVVRAGAIWAEVLALAPRQRAVVVLRYYEDRSETEIAELLGISAGSVKTHAHHALARLRSRLDPSLVAAVADPSYDVNGGTR